MSDLVKRLLVAGIALLPWGGVTGTEGIFGGSGVAWAQDDDDDGDGDDDDDRPTRRNSDGDDDDATAPAPRVTPQRIAPSPVSAPVVTVPLAEQAPDEIVAIDLSPADLAVLLAQGFEVIEERPVPGLAAIVRRLNIPDALTLAAARDVVRSLPSGQDADFNHYYRSEQDTIPVAAVAPRRCDGPHCPAFALVNWAVPADRTQTCGVPIVVGMIDTGLNPDHSTFAGAQIEVLRLSDDTMDPSLAVHGTAVAALLIGDPQSRSPGLIPHARLIAVDAFHRDGSDERADVFALTDALGQLADAQVRVINLSLAGPANSVLEEAIDRLVRDKGIVIVAAAGNDGPAAPPVYPAAYDGVIAVTAVDSSGRAYRRAGQGPHIALAAPGVAVWTAASVSGARDKTGTSFAAPFVTAAATLLLQANPGLTAADVSQRLSAAATDIGAPGRDPVFGHGVVTLKGLCPG